MKIPYRMLLILALLIIAVDFASKEMVHHYLPLAQNYNSEMHPPIPVLNFLGIDFTLIHLTNRGAAWGMFAEYQNALLILRIALIVMLLTYLFFITNDATTAIPLLLISAGAIGNVMDYVIYGHVVDMLHFNFWGYDFPTFNLADTAISLGIAWLFIQSLFASKVDCQQ